MLSYKFVLYTSNTLKNGTHPIYLQVSRRLRRGKYEIRRTSLNLYCKPHQWDEDNVKFRSNLPGYKRMNEELDFYKDEASYTLLQARREKQRLTADDFISRVMDQQNSEMTVYDFFTERMNELSAGNKKFYRATRNKLKTYAGDDLQFTEIDYKFLIGFENWLRRPDDKKKGCSDGGVSIHMRTLSALYNEAVKREYAPQANNPFNKTNPHAYDKSKLKTRLNPEPMEKREWEKWLSFTPTNKELSFWYDVAMFMYYCFGMSFADVLNFKPENVKGNRVYYYRQKTSNVISFVFHPEARRIAERYHLDGTGDGGYVFPILNSTHKTEQQKLDRRYKKIKQFNKACQKIAELQNIKTHITSKTFRYTCVANLKTSNVDKNVISDLLGHFDEKTLRHYEVMFPDDVLEKAAMKL